MHWKKCLLALIKILIGNGQNFLIECISYDSRAELDITRILIDMIRILFIFFQKFFSVQFHIGIIREKILPLSLAKICIS